MRLAHYWERATPWRSYAAVQHEECATKWRAPSKDKDAGLEALRRM